MRRDLLPPVEWRVVSYLMVDGALRGRIIQLLFFLFHTLNAK